MESISTVDAADEMLLSSVKFDSLGPIIINSDGTMSKIPNWDTLTDHEKAKTLRLIAKRNKMRREALINNPPVEEDSENQQDKPVLALENK